MLLPSFLCLGTPLYAEMPLVCPAAPVLGSREEPPQSQEAQLTPEAEGPRKAESWKGLSDPLSRNSWLWILQEAS